MGLYGSDWNGIDGAYQMVKAAQQMNAPASVVVPLNGGGTARVYHMKTASNNNMVIRIDIKEASE